MRTIKFRIWDKTNKRMITEPMITLPDHRGFFWQSAPGYGMRSDMEAELIQFTGLLDANGKEIYEGDIVQIATKSQPPFVVKEFAWLHGSEWEESCYGYDFMGHINEVVEVIGNIYENPDLLKS